MKRGPHATPSQAALAAAVKEVVDGTIVPYFGENGRAGIGQEFVALLLEPDFAETSIKVISQVMVIYRMLVKFFIRLNQVSKERDDAAGEQTWLASQLDSIIEELRGLRKKVK